MSWNTVPLGKLADIRTGKLDVNASSSGGAYPFFTCAKKVYAIDFYDYDCECVLVAGNGDLNVKYFNGKFNAYQRTYIITKKDSINLNIKYLYFFVDSYIDKLRDGAIGGVIKYIKLGNLTSMEVPLPPLAIQKQIAAVLEKADTLRSQCQQMEQELNALAQSVFLDMFGDPVKNPKGWPTYKFKDIGNAQLGKMLSAKSKQGESPKKYLRNANIRWRKIELHDLLEMDFNDKEMKKFKLEYGDILLCEGGEVGRCAIWRDELTDCYYQKALHRIRLNNEIAMPEYVQEYFFWMAKLGGLSASVSEVTFSHLTAAKLSELIIPLPPIELQHSYVSQVSIISDQLNLIESQYIKCNENFESLMQRAFKGELKLKGVA